MKRMRFQKGIGFTMFLVVILLMAYSLASAVPIDPFNTRPVTVGSPPTGEPTLQTILTGSSPYFGWSGLDAYLDQHPAGMWAHVDAGYPLIAPVLRFEYSPLAGTNIFGIWSDPDMDDSTLPNRVDIFFGGATPGTYATLFWSDPNTLAITGPTGVNVGTFSGINPYSFGFYLRPGGGSTYYYTVDQLNSLGAAEALAFRRPGSDTWAIAFNNNIGDFDYNDMVVRVESINPVPEPGTLALLGSGLISTGIYRWRKMKKMKK